MALPPPLNAGAHVFSLAVVEVVAEILVMRSGRPIRGMHDIVRAPAATLARYQIYVIDPATGADVPDASSSHASTQVSVSQAEWDAAQYAIVNNTRLPIGASPGTLNAYHSILEKNRVRLQRAEAELEKRKAAADASSERRGNLPPGGSTGSRSLNSRNVHRPRIPRLSERDVAGITRNLSSSFMTMDSAGLLRPRTAEGATVPLAAYLVKNPPAFSLGCPFRLKFLW